VGSEASVIVNTDGSETSISGVRLTASAEFPLARVQNLGTLSSVYRLAAEMMDCPAIHTACLDNYNHGNVGGFHRI
jgi:hypothetical protein